ncbi:hypothetical protein BDU57DRAFT_516139 [Ampelomyces quisqualis]|uniref:Uncharacterized protein n=1 Tax=Ampelomyces quisqualis TaxID=50730 RepID=A0A6A5QN14_AMPQU|nr:hypothetical protein BDU57DRAFT_516139 [Ampelomyces quisqualis]
MPSTLFKEGKTRPNENFNSSDTLIARDSQQTHVPLKIELPALRYRHRALWLLGFYIPLLVIPWALTCVLVYHPLGARSYYDQAGLEDSKLTLHRRMDNALSVINSFTGIVTVPIISALLTQAAVVYAQRRRKDQFISVRQMFALADQGWSNFGVLHEAWPPWRGHTSGPGAAGSPFLWLAAAFIMLCAVQQPLREALVSKESTSIMTYRDNTAAAFGVDKATARLLGHDAEPFDLAEIPEDIVVQNVMNSLATFDRYEMPPYIWTDPGGERGFVKATSFGFGSKTPGPWMQPTPDYFVAALPNATTTGVLRHRLMRLNSTVDCDQINMSNFPSRCEGQRPFAASYNWTEGPAVRLCVPGERGLYPWETNRNRQDITEDFYLDVSGLAPASGYGNTAYNTTLTLHCSVGTTRGYFEMGNYRNDLRPGPLLDRWEELDPYTDQPEYNDWLPNVWRDKNEYGENYKSLRGRRRRPMAEDKITDIPTWPAPEQDKTPWPTIPTSDGENRTMSGPLMTSILAMFGEQSFFASINESETALSQICESGRMPFITFSGYERYANECSTTSSSDNTGALGSTISKFLRSTFNDTSTAVNHLSAGIYFTNQAMLLQTVRISDGFTARPILTGSGALVQRPTVSKGGLVIVSTLVFFQLIGLAYLAWYIYQVPTWTGLLDALAVASITNSLEKGSIPAIGSMNSSDLDGLNETNGTIGVVNTECEEQALVVDHPGQKSVELGLGAPGLFHRRLVKFRVKRYTDTAMGCGCEGCRRRRAMPETDG